MNEVNVNKIYDILESIGGASSSERVDFVYNLTKSEYPTTEWRFQGYFGFGGKYRPNTNRVTYYREDETPIREELQKRINSELKNIY